MRKKIFLFSALLLVFTGCISQPSTFSYDWETSEKMTFNIKNESYTSIIKIDKDSDIKLWKKSALGGEEPLDITNPKFRYQNGTIINLTSKEEGSRTIIEPPEKGTLAYTAPKQSRQFNQPIPKTGSVKVNLPQKRDARNPILGRISPGDYEILSEEPLSIKWEEIKKGETVEVRYYTKGDPMIFYYFISFLFICGLGVFYYYKRKLKKLREDEEELSSQ